jgi:hypothetical protein
MRCKRGFARTLEPDAGQDRARAQAAMLEEAIWSDRTPRAGTI